MNTLFYSFTIGTMLALILIFLIYFLRKTNKTQLQQIFGVDLILLITTCIFTFFQMQLSEKLNVNPIYFAYFYYIGIVFFPVALYFTVEILINKKINFKSKYLLLFVIPLICLIGLWTNNKTNLFFTNYSLNMNNCEFGILFIINEIYACILYIIEIIHLTKFFKNNYGLFNRQLKLFLAGILFPFILNILGMLKIIETTVYITPISLALSTICFGIALLKLQFSSTLSIALTKIVDRISDGYVVLNEKNMITDYNSTFFKIFNIENEDLNNRHFFDLLKLKNLKGLDETTIISAVNAVRNSNETLIFECEFKNINKFLKIEINNIKSDGIFLGVLILVKDVSEHHKDVETIKSNQNILIEKERLASLGQMISGVAHNLKTPIFSISGATEGLTDLIEEYRSSITDSNVTIQDHQDIAQEMSNWVSKIKDYTTYMSDIITAIRGQAASFTENNYERFSIDELIKRVNILMKHELEQALITLNISYDLNKEITLHGNINSLIQILNNLISNAIQSYEGKPNQVIDLYIKNTNDELIIKIIDYGKGIPPEIKDRLFKEIISTKTSTGTGLGLFISYSNLKTQFNGDLSFKSEVGKGSTFKITLPL